MQQADVGGKSQAAAGNAAGGEQMAGEEWFARDGRQRLHALGEPAQHERGPRRRADAAALRGDQHHRAVGTARAARVQPGARIVVHARATVGRRRGGMLMGVHRRVLAHAVVVVEMQHVQRDGDQQQAAEQRPAATVGQHAQEATGQAHAGRGQQQDGERTAAVQQGRPPANQERQPDVGQQRRRQDGAGHAAKRARMRGAGLQGGTRRQPGSASAAQAPVVEQWPAQGDARHQHERFEQQPGGPQVAADASAECLAQSGGQLPHGHETAQQGRRWHRGAQHARQPFAQAAGTRILDRRPARIDHPVGLSGHVPHRQTGGCAAGEQPAVAARIGIGPYHHQEELADLVDRQYQGAGHGQDQERHPHRLHMIEQQCRPGEWPRRWAILRERWRHVRTPSEGDRRSSARRVSATARTAPHPGATLHGTRRTGETDDQPTMSTSRVSRTNSPPITQVISAITTGYHSPA